MRKNMKKSLLILLMLGSLLGCALKVETKQPQTIPKPVLEQSTIDGNGTLHIPKGDREELMLYIKQLEDSCNK